MTKSWLLLTPPAVTTDARTHEIVASPNAATGHYRRQNSRNRGLGNKVAAASPEFSPCSSDLCDPRWVVRGLADANPLPLRRREAA
ncbi:hypothetical protein TIFTF001_032710 [Ficus carica]|uniref:Uncharacterized protein n=1 Tax=Ficus carica TaxID=3494 RepID=A0AA88J713_FICCA|nr:hypothetical protein TIFTF001_032710 [Ficus carica]